MVAPRFVQVTFLPTKQILNVQRGRTILDIAKENNVVITYDCDGKCTCGTCHVLIEKGREHLPDVSKEERSHLDRQDLPTNARLSCQSRVLGDIVVRICEAAEG